MRAEFLRCFPTRTHPLTVASDPDGLLGPGPFRKALLADGFQIIDAPDPVAQRVAVQRAYPFDAATPMVVVTAGPLRSLPYDLWQMGHRADLALARLEPFLAPGPLHELTCDQLWRLDDARRTLPPPGSPLAIAATRDLILRALYSIDIGETMCPAAALRWLLALNVAQEALPAELAARVLAAMRRDPLVAAWPLESMISDRQVFADFIREQFRTAILPPFTDEEARSAAGDLREARPRYSGEQPQPVLADFRHDVALHDLVPRLAREGVLPPLAVGARVPVPPWAQAAVRQEARDARLDELGALLNGIADALTVPPAGWEHWKHLAGNWAEATQRRYAPDIAISTDLAARYAALATALDDRWRAWLPTWYPRLSGQALPHPHHLFHVTGWLQFLAKQDAALRPALLIMDGMALADWRQIAAVWQARHPDWRMQETLVMAQIPSITSVSRQALVSGVRPARFPATLTTTQHERTAWRDGWVNAGWRPESIAYAAIKALPGEAIPAVVDDSRTRALCLVCTVIDAMLHGTIVGAAGLQAAIGVWLQADERQVPRSPWVERLIHMLLDIGYTLFMTSDHGHIEAVGMGQPQQGVLVEARNKRAQIYDQPDHAQAAHDAFPRTLLWTADGVLPEGCQVLMPTGREAFTVPGETVVSHGGISLDELIVPLITIRR